MKFHDGHTNLSPMSQVVYKNLVDQMARLKILRIKHEKFDYWKTGQPVERTTFWMFVRGVGGDTEGISIVRLGGDVPIERAVDKFGVCESLDDQGWYVCHLR